MLLELFRNHKRWLMFIAMVLVIPSFVVTGIYSYNRMISDDGAIAKVDDQSILPQQFDEAKRQRLENLRVRLGEEFRSNMLDSQEAKVALLEAIMNERSLIGETAMEDIHVSEQVAIEMIKTFPRFQTNGKFDIEKYSNYLAATGMSDEYFVRVMVGDISRTLLTEGITRTTLVPDTTARNIYNLLTEKRDAALHTLSVTDYVGKVKVSDEDAKKYWTDNQSQFQRPDAINVEYVVFTPDLFRDVQPSEEDIKTFYEQNLNRFKAPEERRASHILIDFAQGKDKAKAKAEEIFKQVKADPKSFADVAKKESVDPGSAKEGGDLGWFGKGMMVPAFEEAVFNAKEGDIVGPVESEFGYHVISVTGIKAPAAKPLADVRDEIVKLYQDQESQKRFAEEADNFTNMVYEQSESLKGVIEKYNLKPVTVNNVAAEGPTDPLQKKFLNPHVMENLFGEECLVEKRNTQAIEVAPNTLIAARVNAYMPAHIAKFEDVRADIKSMLTTQRALDAAEKDGQALLAKVKDGSAKDVKFDKAVTVSRSQPQGWDFNLINSLMRVPAKSIPTVIGVRTPSGYTLVNITKSETIEPEKAALDGTRNELAGMFGQAEQTVYFDSLRTKHNAVVLNKDYLPGAEKKTEQQ